MKPVTHATPMLATVDLVDNAPHRLFFALWPDTELRDRIAAVVTQLQRDHPRGGRRLHPDRYHLTLQFLGDFQPLEPSLVDAACRAAGSLQPEAFALALDQAGSFARAGVVWLGPKLVPAALQQLWDALGDALAAAGVALKSAPVFAPHLTVLRNVREPLPPTPIAPLPWPVHEFVLIDSVSGSEPAYRLLGRWQLRRR